MVIPIIPQYSTPLVEKIQTTTLYQLTLQENNLTLGIGLTKTIFFFIVTYKDYNYIDSHMFIR